MDIFFPYRRLWITRAALLAALAGAACSRRQPAKAASADPDEEIVETLEEMGRIADRHGADCERWADEQRRLLGTEKIMRFNERLLSQSAEQRAAFHAKYGDRIDLWQEKVATTSARCTEELKRAMLRPIKVYARPDGGPPRTGSG